MDDVASFIKAARAYGIKNINTVKAFIQMKKPAPRHFYSKLSTKTLIKKTNTVIEPGIDVVGDIKIIRSGGAVRDGQFFVVRERTYMMEANGTLAPITGKGFHKLDRGAFRALQIYKEFGTDTAQVISRLDREKIDAASREIALKVWRKCSGN